MIKLSALAANAAADAVTRQLADGYLHIYEGVQPATCDTPVPRTAKLLAVCRLGNPAFKPAQNGIASAYEIAHDTDAKDTGRPQWFRLFRADHTTAVYDGNITADDKGDMTMRAQVIGQHSEVAVDSCVVRMPMKG